MDCLTGVLILFGVFVGWVGLSYILYRLDLLMDGDQTSGKARRRRSSGVLPPSGLPYPSETSSSGTPYGRRGGSDGEPATGPRSYNRIQGRRGNSGYGGYLNRTGPRARS